MKNIFKSVLIISFAVLFLPALAFAQGTNTVPPSGVTFTNAPAAACPTGPSISSLICTVSKLLNSIVPLLLALGVVYFVWGVVQYVIGDSEEAKKKGRDRIIYGIVGMAVIIGFWGLVNLVVNTFDLNQNVTVPTLVPTTTAANAGSTCTVPSDVQTLLGFGTCIIQNSLIPFLFAVAILMFIWGAIKFFILNSDEEAKREQGKQFMIWGVIAIAVMLTVWGLVHLLAGTIGLDKSVLPSVKPS